MTSLVKKPQKAINAVFDVSHELSSCITARLRVVDCASPIGRSEVRVVVDRVIKNPDGRLVERVSEHFAITHTQDLDDLILALTALRETYA